MTELQEMASTALASLVGLGLLWIFFHKIYLRYREDLFRQRMFDLRDQLFDLADTGTIDFNHPAYGLLRQTMNWFIRFGHRIRFFSVAWILFYIRPNREFEKAGIEEFNKLWERHTAKLEPEVKEKLDQLAAHMNLLVIDQFVFTSLMLLLTIVSVVLVLTAWQIIDRVQAYTRYAAIKLKDITGPIDSTAMVIGEAA